MLYQRVRSVKKPRRGTPGSAGIDLYVPGDFSTTPLLPNEDILIPAGIKVEVPDNHALIFLNKSSVSTKKKLIVGAQVIDSDYQGEIHIHLFNVGKRTVDVCPGDKLAQMLIVPVSHENLCETDIHKKPTERGEGGFGSTEA